MQKCHLSRGSCAGGVWNLRRLSVDLYKITQDRTVWSRIQTRQTSTRPVDESNFTCIYLMILRVGEVIKICSRQTARPTYKVLLVYSFEVTVIHDTECPHLGAGVFSLDLVGEIWIQRQRSCPAAH